MKAVVCENCGRKYKRSAFDGVESKECKCGHTIEAPRGVSGRLGHALLFGAGFAVVAALIPLIGFFDWRWKFGWNRQAWLGGLLSFLPFRGLVGFAIGAAVGWFNHGWAIRAFDWFTEKPRSE